MSIGILPQSARPTASRPRSPRGSRPGSKHHPDILELEPRRLMATYPLSSVPALNSLPGARVSLYLDFVGDSISQWAQFTNITIPAFDQDGDPTTFSDGELSAITNIWQSVAEDYSPFNINVTTVPPTSMAAGVTLKVDIGGNGAWLGGTPTGFSDVGDFMDPGLNVAFAFPANIGSYAPDVATIAAHEAGHGFGLLHQSVYDSSGNLTAEYNPGLGNGTAPIMGTDFAYWPRPISRWWDGPSDLCATCIQDDMAVIAGTAPGLTTGTETGVGYRPAPSNMSAATAAPLAISGASVSGSGIIRLPGDVDYYSFTTGAGQVTLSALVQTGINDLVPQLELFDPTGTVRIASAGPDANDNDTITTTLAAGTYKLAVLTDGTYGNVGQYTVSGTIVPTTNTINPPTNVAAVASSTSQVNLTWADNATNETGYAVERSGDGVNWTTLTSTLPAGSTGFTDTTASPGTTYQYLVYAYNASMASANSNLSTATTLTVAPSGLAASAMSSAQVNLSWGNVTGETGFQVQRSQDGVTWSLVGATGPGVTSYQDTGVSASTTYQYRVDAIDAGGASACSNLASTTTPATLAPPVAPAGLVAVAGSATRVALTWQDNSSNESGFLIERSSNAGKSWAQIGQAGPNVTTYTDSTVGKNKSYSYRVRAYNAAGDSAYSNVAPVTTPAHGPSVDPGAGGLTPPSPSPSSQPGGIAPIASSSPQSPPNPAGSDPHLAHQRRSRPHKTGSAHRPAGAIRHPIHARRPHSHEAGSTRGAADITVSASPSGSTSSPAAASPLDAIDRALDEWN